MEIFELRYFLGVAEDENLHRASERLRISPPSLSKAISRLEAELGIKLFIRSGRHIKLTDHGQLLRLRAAEILQLEEAARLQVAGHRGSLRVVVTGPEILLSRQGFPLTQRIKSKFPLSSFEFRTSTDEEALGQVSRGEAHLAISTASASQKNLTSKIIGETTFQTCVGEKHPLFSLARSGKTVPLEKLLRYAFVSPSSPILGSVGIKQSLDGWRDDRFPRKVEFQTSSLKLLEKIVTSGEAVAYLPDYFAKEIGVASLEISGCPYSCSQKIRLVTRAARELGWLNQIL